jgi:peptidoglycan/LPS O-acetylase OafA/YrhL
LDRRRIQFLDGLRGWASLVVFFEHMALSFGFPWRFIGYPPFTIILDGQLAVAIFFVLSGYVLSYPVLGSRRRYRTLSGMALTRYTRLTIPILASCLLAQALWLSGLLFNAQVGQLLNDHWLSYFYNFTPEPGELWRFALFNVYFAYDNARNWNGALWTMGFELQGSFLIFAIVGLPFRALRVVGAFCLAYWYYGHHCFGFFLGYFLAEMSMLGFVLPRSARAWGGGFLILGGIAFECWRLRQPILNASVLHCQLAAAVVLAGILFMRQAQTFLSNRVSEFLGSISFPLYLVHIPILFSVGCGVYLLAAPHVSYMWAWAITVFITVPAVFSAAVVFRMLIEDRLVQWTKRGLLAILDRLWPIAPLAFHSV